MLLFSLGCSQSHEKPKVNNTEKNEMKSQNANNEYFGNELIKADYLKFSNPEKLDSLKSEITSSFSIYDEETYKFCHIDAEELSEFSFDFFFPELNKILEKRKVNLNVEPAENYEKTNDIIINGEKINLYTKAELENQTFWNTAPRNFFKKVNEILKSKNLDEKFYLLYGGNDLATLLLTENQFKIIEKYYKEDKNEIPYLP